MKKHKVYTRTGDKGTTSLIGGKRVKKYSDRIEAYGTVDELNAYIGLIRDALDDKLVINQLIRVQHHLMAVGTELAVDNEFDKTKLSLIQDKNIKWLEEEIDRIEKDLPVLQNFILLGGHTTVSYCHIARTICRRAERKAIYVTESFDTEVLAIPYLNRLSDYLFVLARKLSKDLNANEILWDPNLED